MEVPHWSQLNLPSLFDPHAGSEGRAIVRIVGSAGVVGGSNWSLSDGWPHRRNDEASVFAVRFGRIDAVPDGHEVPVVAVEHHRLAP